MAKLLKKDKVSLLTEAGVDLTGDETSAELDSLLFEHDIVAEKDTFKYHVTVTVNEKTKEFDTNDIFESLKSFEVPDSIKTDVVLTATHGDRKAEVVFGVFKGRRTFNNKTALELAAINLTKQLG